MIYYNLPSLFVILFVCVCKTNLLFLTPPEGKKSKRTQKGKVSLTASYASTVGEELIVLLRKLHSLPVWNGPINAYIAQQLRKVVAMVRDEEEEDSDQVTIKKNFIKGIFQRLLGDSSTLFL